jgi:hypothetical protein
MSVPSSPSIDASARNFRSNGPWLVISVRYQWPVKGLVHPWVGSPRFDFTRFDFIGVLLH